MMRLSARATASFVGRSSVTSAVSRATKAHTFISRFAARAASRWIPAIGCALLARVGSARRAARGGVHRIEQHPHRRRDGRDSRGPAQPARLRATLPTPQDEGDSVHVGDTVAVLEQPGLSALIEQRRALADAASTRTAEIRAAEADSQRIANDLARARVLAGQGIASAQELERLQAAAAAAGARLQAVRASVRESQAARAAAEATASIRDQLVLLSPADGIVLTRFAERGEVIAAGVPVVSVGMVHNPWIRA